MPLPEKLPDDPEKLLEAVRGKALTVGEATRVRKHADALRARTDLRPSDLDTLRHVRLALAVSVPRR